MIESAGLFVFPWDFVDEGVDQLIERAVNMGITHLILASHYHAGFFLYSHNPKRKTHLLEDGVAYFHPHEQIYVDGPIRPKIAQMCQETDWFGVICERATTAGLKVIAWTVFCHNTRIGLEYPQVAIQNVFGDVYPHALSPGHPATQAFARGLVTDLAKHYPLDAVMLEAPNYRGRRHGGTWVAGHHHERDGVHLRELELKLMDISFNEADVKNATQQGVDMQSLRDAAREHLEQYFAQAPEEPPNIPATIDAFGEQCPALVAYGCYINKSEHEFITQLREQAQPHNVKLMGNNDSSVDLVMVGAYGLNKDEMTLAIQNQKSHLLEHQSIAVLLRMGFHSPGMGTPMVSQQMMETMVQTAIDQDASMVGFYNYAESPIRSVEWIKPALRSVGFKSMTVSKRIK